MIRRANDVNKPGASRAESGLLFAWTERNWCTTYRPHRPRNLRKLVTTVKIQFVAISLKPGELVATKTIDSAGLDDKDVN